MLFDHTLTEHHKICCQILLLVAVLSVAMTGVSLMNRYPTKKDPCKFRNQVYLGCKQSFSCAPLLQRMKNACQSGTKCGTSDCQARVADFKSNSKGNDVAVCLCTKGISLQNMNSYKKCFC